MTYRSDQVALNNRKLQLEQRLGELRAKIHEGKEANKVVDSTVKELEELYAEYNSYATNGTQKRSLPLLQRIFVASPCNVPWESMQGDERVRHCGSCDKQVFDLSALTTVEAEKLLAENNNICAQYYRREDGTILTADCPVGVEKKRKTRRKAVVIAATIASTVAGAALAASVFSRGDEPEEQCSSTMMTNHNTTPQTLGVTITDKPPTVLPADPVVNPNVNVVQPQPTHQRMGGAVSVRPNPDRSMMRGDVAFK